jgi:hypothetical protein
LIDACGKKNLKNAQLPKFGICVFVEAKKSKAEIYSLVTYRKVDYLLRREGDKIT